MVMPHQVELFIVSTKDKRPSPDDITHACTTPEGFLTYCKKTGRTIINDKPRDLYVFRLKVPVDVDVTYPEDLDEDYANLIGLHRISDSERIKLIRHGKFRFTNNGKETEVNDKSSVTLYDKAVRIS